LREGGDLAILDRMNFRVDVAGVEKEIEVTRQADRLRITYDGSTTEVRVVHTEGAHFVLEYDQPAGEFVQRRRLRAAGHMQGDSRQLWVNGSNLDYRRVRPEAARAPAGDGSLASSIPAVVSEVLVAVGDQVEAGEKLILLESMKMILPIQAPHAGTVAAIHCAPGEAVQPGVPLLALE
jgi:biotin carboxyl carrier protein